MQYPGEVSAIQNAIRVAIRNAWVESEYNAQREDSFPDGNSNFHSIQSTILEVVQLELQELTRAHNASQPFYRLPVELLAEVFARIPIQQRLLPALVCKAWCQAMFSSPRIWNIIRWDWDTYESTATLARLLELSAECSLHLDISIGAEGRESICELLETNLHRCVELRVSFIEPHPSATVCARLTSTLLVPAPRLQRFYLFDIWKTFNNGMDGTTRLFNGDAPALTLVKLQCDLKAMQWSGDALQHAQTVMFSPSGHFAREDLETLAVLFRGAEAITVDVDDWYEVTSGQNHHLPPVQFTPTLQTFVVLSNNEGGFGRSVLRNVHTTNIPFVWLWYNKHAVDTSDPAVIDILTHRHILPEPSQTEKPDDNERIGSRRIHSFIPRTICLEFATVERYPLQLYLYEQDVEIRRHTRHSPTLPTTRPPCSMRVALYIGNDTPIQPGLFAHATRMYLTETVISAETIGHPLPEFPSLISLTIYTLKATSHKISHVYSAFISASDEVAKQRRVASLSLNAPAGLHSPKHRLICPQLELVHIAARASASWSTPPTRLTPETVHACILTYLHYKRPRLVMLQLSGIDMLVVEPMDLELMLSLAEEIVWDDRCVSSSYSSNATFNWL
ncbi:hypothetical protein BKA62DRAFT_96440 [Auriculariales sp. MPI-PUGE-AT-0066]|nr:hypothetical protein BKA62DRAFT_96440 [Auriculariales sp. MPI-PUGE-AT-0066]